jgi:hypothetical protein
MHWQALLFFVQGDRIAFLTARPENSPFVTLERRVVVTGPPELVELSRTGDVAVLDELVKLLDDPNRAWAAEVILAAMTGEEGKMVDSFATRPADWWKALGTTARERWRKWLAEVRDRLLWDPAAHAFVERAEKKQP